jgi:hypothetical protein
VPPGVRRGFRYRLVPLPPPLRLARLAPRAQHLAGALERPHPSLRGAPCRPAFSNWPQHRLISLSKHARVRRAPLADVEPRWSLAARPLRRIPRCIDAHLDLPRFARTAAFACLRSSPLPGVARWQKDEEEARFRLLLHDEGSSSGLLLGGPSAVGDEHRRPEDAELLGCRSGLRRGASFGRAPSGGGGRGRCR